MIQRLVRMDGRGSGSGAAPFPPQIPSLHAVKLPYSCVLIYRADYIQASVDQVVWRKTTPVKFQHSDGKRQTIPAHH